MTSGVKPAPEGYHSVTPYLVLNDAAGAIEFCKTAFGASELMRMAAPGGRIGHAELRIGDSRIMLADEFPEIGARSARTIGGSPVHIYLYVEDVDAVTGRRSRPARRSSARSRISSTATARAASKIPSATSGTSRPTRRTYRPTS